MKNAFKRAVRALIRWAFAEEFRVLELRLQALAELPMENHAAIGALIEATEEDSKSIEVIERKAAIVESAMADLAKMVWEMASSPKGK